nr:reverse transcriptase domain-containing protein [Tanacetum cinerariifolium]
MNFMVVRSPSPYNRIIGRPGVRKIQAVPSTAQEMLKFLVQGGILTLRGSRIIPLECTMVSGLEAQPSDVIQRRHDLGLQDGFGAGLILTNPKGAEFTYALRFRFDATNNEAKYEGLIAGLRIVERMGVKNLQTNMDSRLVANQVNRSYIAKEPGMIQYLEKVKTLFNSFKKFSVKQVPSSENKKADVLSKITSTSFAHLTKQFLVEELNEKSINEADVLAVMEEERDTWMTPIYNYLTKETLLAEKEKARVIRRKSGRYTVINEVHRLVPRNPQQKLTPIMSSWPFYIARPFLEGPGKVKFLIVAMDYFAKWIEAKPIATIMVIPAKIGMPTLRTTEIDMVQNDEALKINLDLLKERKEQAAVREARSKAKMEKYYNSKVRNTSFKPGDLVYRNNNANHAKDSGKLSLKWEGSYEVMEALGKGVYKLRDRNGKLLPRTWNVRNLKKCYVHEM